MGDMNAPLRVRVREGCRGGKEQFQWNQIKDQDFKDREQYLGSSMKVGLMGKFGRYYVHDWYARKRQETESITEERESVQAYEEELMKEALGLKPKKLLLAKKELTEEEMKEFLKRDSDKSADKQGRAQMGPQAKIVTNEVGEQVATSNEEYVAIAAREAPVKGLGFAHHRSAKLEAIKAETFGTESELVGTRSASSSAKIEPKDEVKSEMTDNEGGRGFGVVDAQFSKQEDLDQVRRAPFDEGGKRQRDDGVEAKVKKEKKDKKDKKSKAEKKLRKIEKKLKKAEKKERRAAKKMRVAVGSSSSSSSA